MRANPPINTPKAVLPGVILVIVQALLLFGSAGTLAWWNGWVYLLYNLLSGLSVSLFIYRNTPDLAAERRTASKKAQNWDKPIVFLLVLVFPVATLVLSGLDHRFGWTRSITPVLSLGALAVMAASSALIFWAMKTNRFFSSFVRIQKDRGQTAIQAGPYAYVRHPAYLGMMLGGLAIPVQLGSLAALWAGLANFLLVVFRTVLEDQTLLDGLKGYGKYAKKVRYRLVPFIY